MRPDEMFPELRALTHPGEYFPRLIKSAQLKSSSVSLRERVVGFVVDYVIPFLGMVLVRALIRKGRRA